MLQVDFAGVSCAFDTKLNRSLFDNWQWKLDSYCIERDAKIDIEVGLGEGACLEEDMLLLRDEPAGFFHRQVWKKKDASTVWRLLRMVDQSTYLQYEVSSDWKSVKLHKDRTQSAGSIAFEYLGQFMPYSLLSHSILTFHGVLVEHNGRGLIFSAPSGTGKTTHARLWRDYKNALILNGDRATCRKVNDTWVGYGLPWSGTSGEQINRKIPITALVIIERAPKNIAEQICGMDAFGAIWPHVQVPEWDEVCMNNALTLVDDFISNVPVIRLLCTPDVESVDVLNCALETLNCED